MPRKTLEANVVTSCAACNQAKRDRTREEFEAWAVRLVQHGGLV